MAKKILRFFKENLFVLVLVGLVVVIAVLNYEPGKWLTGWDNLHPEFNFGLNFRRAFSFWQEEGLGFIGGHGYMATLPHTLFLWVLSFVLPLSFLRYFFTFLMLLVGSVGCFYFTRELLGKMGKKSGTSINMASFLAGLFYMLNLGTVQNFYIQLEAFIVHFAFLPWLFYSLLLCLRQSSRKNLFVFGLLSFLSSPQGFIPPLFIIYALFLGIILFFYVLVHKSLKRIKKSLLIVVITLVMNAYWLLPATCYTFSGSQDYISAYNNLHSTENFIYKNKKYGQIKDVALLKGFIFEANDVVDTGGLVKILRPWIDHLEQKQILTLGYVFFGLVLIGAGYLFFSNRKNCRIGFFLCFLISFAALATDLFPFSYFSLVLEKLPVFKQAFRVAFTKFSISLSLIYAAFFGIGVYFLMSILFKKIKRSRAALLMPILLVVLLIYFSWPVFSGNFIYQRTKIDIPQVYFDLFEFFKKQNSNGRIANFPQGWNWGWSVYKWDYSGSGFLWYGIEQPIMDRAFDVWSRQNENYYWQIVYAIYSENWLLFESLMEKYQINWLIFDKNIIPYQNTRAFLYVDNFEEYLNQSRKFTQVAEFKSVNLQPIKVFRVNLDKQDKNYVILADNLTHIEPEYDWNSDDQFFLENGHYVSIDNPPFITGNTYYPFGSLFTGRRPEELEFEVNEGFNSIIFANKIPSQTADFQLMTPSLKNEEAFFWTKELEKGEVATPSVQIRDGKIEVEVEKREGYFSYDSNLDEHFLNHEPRGSGVVFKQEKEVENQQEFVRFTSVDSENFFDIVLDNLSQGLSYLVKIESRNTGGKSLLFAVINQDSKKTDIEISLPKNKEFNTSFIIIPPMKPFGAGYSLHFDNISIGREKTVNDLGRVEVYPIPYRFLKGIKFIKNQGARITNQEGINSELFDVDHPNPSFYKVTYNPSTSLRTSSQEMSDDLTLVLSQAFDQGWIAWEGRLFLGKKLEHFLVNNWENGWEVSGEKPETIYIFFWPQLLEFLGLGMLLGLFGWLIFGKLKRK